MLWCSSEMGSNQILTLVIQYMYTRSVLIKYFTGGVDQIDLFPDWKGGCRDYPMLNEICWKFNFTQKESTDWCTGLCLCSSSAHTTKFILLPEFSQWIEEMSLFIQQQVKPGFTTTSRNQSIFRPEVNEEAKKSYFF